MDVCQGHSYIPTYGQSVSLPWCQAPIWNPRPDFCYCQTVEGLWMWGVLSDGRTGLSFTITAGPRQSSHSWVRVPRDSCLYFTVSDSRLPQPGWSSTRIYITQEQRGPVIPPGIGFPYRHRAAVEVFEPASTQGLDVWLSVLFRVSYRGPMRYVPYSVLLPICDCESAVVEIKHVARILSISLLNNCNLISQFKCYSFCRRLAAVDCNMQKKGPYVWTTEREIFLVIRKGTLLSHVLELFLGYRIMDGAPVATSVSLTFQECREAYIRRVEDWICPWSFRGHSTTSPSRTENCFFGTKDIPTPFIREEEHVL
jgi:hypothetical protein